MFRKSLQIIAIIVVMVMALTTSTFAWKLAVGNLTLGSPYTATWEGIGNLDGTATGSALLVDAAIEWVNPTGKSVISGVGGEQDIIATSDASIYVDDSGKVTITTQFPYLVEHCRLVDGCANLIAGFDPDLYDPNNPATYPDPDAEAAAFLEFYQADIYKDNWDPTRMIMLELELWATTTQILNDNITKTEDSPYAVCIANRTYRTFIPPIDYICNEIGDPFGIEDAYVLKKDTFSGDVLENDFDRNEFNDPDSGEYPLAAQLLQGPQYGDLTLNSDGTFTYTITSSDFYANGDDFSYTPVDALSNEGNETWVKLTSFK